MGTRAGLVLTLLLGGLARAAPPPEGGATAATGRGPGWTLELLRGSLNEVAAAGRLGTVAAKDAALTVAMARAYGVRPRPRESTRGLAERTLRTRRPHHPSVRSGHEVLALARQFYQDVGERAGGLARFERTRKTKAWLEARAAEAAAAERTLSGELQVELPGLDGFFGLPPEVDRSPRLGEVGARAEVTGYQLVIGGLPRATLPNHRSPTDARRTRGGALVEVRAALKQHMTTAAMLGRYDAKWKRGRRRVHFVAPASAPSIYLLELVRAGREVGLETVLVVVTARDQEGQVGALPVRLRRPRGAAVPVRCPVELSMQGCAERLATAQRKGRAFLEL